MWNRTRRVAGLLGALLLSGLCAGSLLLAGSPASPASQDAAAQAQPAAKPTAQASKSSSSPAYLEIPSVLSVELEMDLLTQRRGVVQHLYVDQGSVVQKGALLAKLEDRDLLAQLDKERANLQVAENNVKYNEAELKAKEAAYRRARQMREAGLNSEADLEEAEFHAKGAQYDLDSWRAAVERQKADIRILELELERTQIRAPFAGVIARRYIRVGQDVLKDDKCFRLSQLSPLRVRFLVPETSPRRPRVGETVRMTIVADPSLTASARISTVSPVVDAASGSFEVVATLANPSRDLRPGMSVRVFWLASTAAGR